MRRVEIVITQAQGGWIVHRGEEDRTSIPIVATDANGVLHAVAELMGVRLTGTIIAGDEKQWVNRPDLAVLPEVTP